MCRVGRPARYGAGGALSGPGSGNAAATHRVRGRRQIGVTSFSRRHHGGGGGGTDRRPTPPVRSPPAGSAAAQDRQATRRRGRLLPRRRRFAARRRHRSGAARRTTALRDVQELVELGCIAKQRMTTDHRRACIFR